MEANSRGVTDLISKEKIGDASMAVSVFKYGSGNRDSVSTKMITALIEESMTVTHHQQTQQRLMR
eukprot:scaffold298413_cov19-Prasinocladus_malaysianus.AAC.1